MVIVAQTSDFPEPAEAWGDAPLGISRALGPELVAQAYRLGIFPWYNPGEPVLWWSPDPRFVLYPEEARFSPRLLRAHARAVAEGRITFDQAMVEVIQGCAETPRPGQNGTWITPEMIDVYSDLHREGLVHSVEVWRGSNLVGGLYGVTVGTCFCGESMFFRESDASKLALVHLVQHLQSHGFRLIDCQQPTAHLARFGAREIPRADFLQQLAVARKEEPHSGVWTATGACPPTTSPPDPKPG